MERTVKDIRLHLPTTVETLSLKREGGAVPWHQQLRIPAQAGQRFQPKLDSNSKATWTLIPARQIGTDHGFIHC